MHAGVGIELLSDLTSGLCSAAGGVLVEYIQYACFLCVCVCTFARVVVIGAFYSCVS